MHTDFELANSPYLLSHSVGRPLKTLANHVNEAFFSPWQHGAQEPWANWLPHIDLFTEQLAQLFNSKASLFCPQVNLSSALTKLVMSHPRLQKSGCRVLLSEQDFPSMGFVLKHALPEDAELVFIPHNECVTDSNVWAHYLNESIDLVFISHVYSNSGQQAPVSDIVAQARQHGVLSCVDVAQGAGVIACDLTQLNASFMIGSAVKWLCSGPGAAYLWVNERELEHCKPKDVGWFSHQNPFEFDIHSFRYHPSALRFWGGTPSVMPYIMAAHSMAWFNAKSIQAVRAHNVLMQNKLLESLGEFLVSPHALQKRSGTLIFHFNERQQAVKTALDNAGIAVDERALGIRVSPHVYNTQSDLDAFVHTAKITL